MSYLKLPPEKIKELLKPFAEFRIAMDAEPPECNNIDFGADTRNTDLKAVVLKLKGFEMTRGAWQRHCHTAKECYLVLPHQKAVEPAMRCLEFFAGIAKAFEHDPREKDVLISVSGLIKTRCYIWKSTCKHVLDNITPNS